MSQLPWNQEAERTVLGAVLIDNAAFESAAQTLAPDDFFSTPHADIFRAMQALANRGEGIDTVSLMDELQRAKSSVSALFVVSLVDGLPRLTNVEQWARLVRRDSYRRQLAGAAVLLHKTATDPERDPDEAAQGAIQRILDVADRGQGDDWIDKGRAIKETLRELEAQARAPGGVVGLATGFVDLDALLQGLVPGTHIVAARSGRGKSVLAAQIAAHAASTAEGSVAVFSLEMAANSMLKRWLSWIAKVNVNRLHAASTNDLRDRWARLVKAAGDLLQKRLELNTTATDVPQIWRKCLGLKAKKGLSLVVVDYVQLIDVGRQMEKRYLEIREISRSLAMMAKHLGVPVLAVAQLNRESTRRKDNRPSEEDIADGDSLLRDATTCLLIHRDLVAQKGQDQRDLEGLAELILSKNRHGRTGTVRVKWDRLLACFEDSERGAV